MKEEEEEEKGKGKEMECTFCWMGFLLFIT